MAMTTKHVSIFSKHITCCLADVWRQVVHRVTHKLMDFIDVIGAGPRTVDWLFGLLSLGGSIWALTTPGSSEAPAPPLKPDSQG